VIAEVSGTKQQLASSTDRGAHWAVLRWPARRGGIVAVALTGRTTSWALTRTDTGRVALWRTDDGWRHAVGVALPDPLAREIALPDLGLQMLSDGHGWIAAGQLWATSDGGRSWDAVD
jgi:hypothetical protein